MLDNVIVKNFYNEDYKSGRYLASQYERWASYLDIINKGTVLDLGIGIGQYTPMLIKHGFKVTGVDLSEYAIEKLKKEYPLHEFYVDDILNFYIRESSYDFIICAMVLHHITREDITILIERIKRGLKKEGMVFISMLSDRDPTFNMKGITDEGYLKIVRSHFALNELHEYFSDYTTIDASDMYFKSNRNGQYMNYYGVIVYMGQKS